MKEEREDQQQRQDEKDDLHRAYDLSGRIHEKLEQVQMIYGSSLAALLSLLREESKLYAEAAARAAVREEMQKRNDPPYSPPPFVYPTLPTPNWPFLPGVQGPAIYKTIEVGDDPNAKSPFEITCDGESEPFTLSLEANTTAIIPTLLNISTKTTSTKGPH